MGTLFIADLHLDDSRPQITALFENYLASDEVRRADALYILGDLFEAWIGDDDDAELPRRIAAATRAVRDAGVPPAVPASSCWRTAACTRCTAAPPC